LIVAEVSIYFYIQIHSINQDKTYNVHTRTQKYGKLEAGLMIQVPHKLIKRQKHHLITL
jgi:exosome complex component RRP4